MTRLFFLSTFYCVTLRSHDHTREIRDFYIRGLGGGRDKRGGTPKNISLQDKHEQDGEWTIRDLCHFHTKTLNRKQIFKI